MANPTEGRGPVEPERRKAIRWTDADRAALAAVRTSDIAAAAREWRESAPSRFRALLEGPADG